MKLTRSKSPSRETDYSGPIIRSKPPSIQKLIEERGHMRMLLPKFHCELNPIERCWVFSKRYIRERPIDKISPLKERIRESLSSLDKTLIRKIFRKVRGYERAYREGAPTSEIDVFAKKI